jgi:uncharacterized protein
VSPRPPRLWSAALRALWLGLLAAWLGVAGAQDLLPVPPLSGRVIDQTATLQPAEQQALDAKLAAFEAEAGPQIVVLMVATTQPEDIAAYAQRVGEAWKIGRRDVGDGLLIVVAKNDRRVNIQTAKALEGAIPDLAARQIIDRAIRPAFRANDYAGGLNAAADQLFARLRGEALPLPEAAPSQKVRSDRGLQLEELAMFFFVAVPVVGAVLRGVLGRKLGTVATAGATGAVAWWLTTSLLAAGAAAVVALVMVGLFGARNLLQALGNTRGGVHVGGWGGGGSSWGGGGGGGFSSGGGGDFGGGGASGDW